MHRVWPGLGHGILCLPLAGRSRALLGALGLLLTLTLGGCRGWNPPPPMQRAWESLPFTGPGPTPTPPYRTLTVATTDEGARRARLEALLDQYAQERAGIRIQLQQIPPTLQGLRKALSGERPPDLILVDGFHFPDLAAEGLLAPAGEALAPDGDFFPALVRAFTWQGALYCLPREVRTLALIYDAGKFEAAGLAPPSTWDELAQAAEALTDLNTGSFGFIEAPDLSRWLPFLYQAGGEIVDDSGRVALNGPPARAALEFYIQLYRDNFAGHPGESNSSWAGEVLGKGKGGMAVEGNWVAPYFAAEFPDFRYGVAPLPRGPGGRGTVAFTSCYALAAASRQPHAAAALMAYLTSPNALARWAEDGASMPPRPSLIPAWVNAHPALEAFASAIDQARVWQFPPGLQILVQSFNRGMVELFAANIDAPDLLAEVQAVGE